MAIDVAFQQAVWLAFREMPISIGGLDAIFSADGTIWSCFKFQLLKKANIAVTVSLRVLKWLMPLSALITPATLTVTRPSLSEPLNMMVPSINFSIVEPLYNWSMSVRIMEDEASNNGITPYMYRILSSTTTSAQILPMKALAPGLNSTYQLTFWGPSLRCNPASPLIHEAISGMANVSFFVRTGIHHTMTVNLDNTGDAGVWKFETGIAWLALAPTSQILTLVEEAGLRNRPLSDRTTQQDFIDFALNCVVLKSDFTDFILDEFNITGSSPLCEGISGFNPAFPKNVTHNYVSNTLTSPLNTNNTGGGSQTLRNYGRL